MSPLSSFLPGEEEALIERLRRTSPTQKLAEVAALNRLEAERRRAEIRARCGEVSEEEMRMRLGAWRLGRETMIEVFGWDPGERGW